MAGRADRTEPEILVFDTVDDLQADAARLVADGLGASNGGQQVHLALSGGSTPRRMHELLARTPGVNWANVHVYWGDERTVPPESDQSNYRMARESLLDLVPIPETHVHRMRGELDPHEAADEYERVMAESFGVVKPDVPRLDVNVLGIGADGHTASLFPGTQALTALERWVVANEVPQQNTWRITLTYRVLNRARLTLVLVTGQEKAGAVRRIFDPNETDRPPAAFVQPVDGRILWLLDRGAAEGLPRLTAQS